MSDTEVIEELDEVENTSAPSTDTDMPVINIKQKTHTIKANETINLFDGVTASDATDGDLTSQITTNINELDFSKEGIKKVEYKVSDNAGNTTVEYAYVTVKKDNTNIIRFGQIGIAIVALVIIVLLGKYIRSIILEKRFSKFTINSSKNKSISLFDNLYLQYIDFIEKLGMRLSKYKIFVNVSKRYEKYVTAFELDKSINFIAKKIVVGFIFIIFTILVELLQSRLAGALEILISFIIGFYTLDIIYSYRYFRYRKKIEKDLLDAITLMNNAFKSGMSITQAIDLVSKDSSGPISIEFDKISKDISMGLDIEIAFKRFSKRIKTDEALYLSSSLSVLSKTGGNIIKVFSSIEKNMFNRRKLENELKSLTASSKLIMVVLLIVPPLFMIFINFVNRDYFKSLFNNPLGIILLMIMLLIYVLYIFVVTRTLKVRGIK